MQEVTPELDQEEYPHFHRVLTIKLSSKTHGAKGGAHYLRNQEWDKYHNSAQLSF